MSNRRPESATQLSADEYAAFANECTRYAQTFVEASEAAKAAGGLSTYNAKTGRNALIALGNFADYVDKSLRELRLGRPIKNGQLKARSTAKRTM